MINQKERIHYASKMAPKDWYTGEELEHLWRVTTAQRRKITAALRDNCMTSTTGRTSKIKYKVRPASAWQRKKKYKTKKKPLNPPEKTGNGVIDAKLREKAGLAAIPSTLENLISAATEIGTENEIIKQALREIDAIITKVREYL